MKVFIIAISLFTLVSASAAERTDPITIVWGLAAVNASQCTNCWPNYITLPAGVSAEIQKEESGKKIFIKFLASWEGNAIRVTLVPLHTKEDGTVTEEAGKSAVLKPGAIGEIPMQGFQFTISAAEMKRKGKPKAES